jgi:Tol biopolymer transport system component
MQKAGIVMKRPFIYFPLLLGMIVIFWGASWLQAAVAGSDVPASTTLISADLNGLSPDGQSSEPVVSANGRFIAFASAASNLVANDTNGFEDVFLYDRWLGVMTRISEGAGGVEGNGDTGEDVDISPDGRFIVFASGAKNLVPTDNNNLFDVFLYDRFSQTLDHVSFDETGAQFTANASDPAVSADGRFVVFVVGSQIYLRDRQLGQTSLISRRYADGSPSSEAALVPDISGDGRYIVFSAKGGDLFPGDTNNRYDIFLYDRHADAVIDLISDRPDGTQANNDARDPVISADGRFVAFATLADNLLDNDANMRRLDTFIYDIANQTLSLASVSSTGEQSGLGADRPALSWDGRTVAFQSGANNLVTGDTNGFKSDIFVRDIDAGQTTRASVPFTGGEWPSESRIPHISGDGRFVVFLAQNDNEPLSDPAAQYDVYLRDTGNGRISQTVTISTTGGTLIQPTYGMTVTIPANTFASDVNLTVNGIYPSPHLFPVDKWGVGPYFNLSATDTLTGQPVLPVNGITVTVQYSPLDKLAAAADTLALYRWDGAAWVKEPSSVVNTDDWTVTAVIQQTGTWAVAGDSYAVLLPVIL